jgi:hypothetical protein
MTRAEQQAVDTRVKELTAAAGLAVRILARNGVWELGGEAWWENELEQLEAAAGFTAASLREETTMQSIVEQAEVAMRRINAGAYGFRIIRPGPEYGDAEYALYQREDTATGLCQLLSTRDLVALGLKLGELEGAEE